MNKQVEASANPLDWGKTIADIQGERDALFLLLANSRPQTAWKSFAFRDGQPAPSGYFIAGIETLTGGLAFLLPIRFFLRLSVRTVPAALCSANSYQDAQRILYVGETHLADAIPF